MTFRLLGALHTFHHMRQRCKGNDKEHVALSEGCCCIRHTLNSSEEMMVVERDNDVRGGLVCHVLGWIGLDS